MKIVRGDELERDSGLVQGSGDIFYYTQLFLGFTLRNLGKRLYCLRDVQVPAGHTGVN